jgi:hypothetical protein
MILDEKNMLREKPKQYDLILCYLSKSVVLDVAYYL